MVIALLGIAGTIALRAASVNDVQTVDGAQRQKIANVISQNSGSGGGGGGTGAAALTNASNTLIAGTTQTINGSLNTSNLAVFSGALISTNTNPQTNSFSYITAKANNAATGRIISFLKQSDGSFLGHIREDGNGFDLNDGAGNFQMGGVGFVFSGEDMLLNSVGFNQNGANSSIGSGSFSVTLSGANAIFNSLTNTFSGQVQIGSTGTLITLIKSATASLDFPNILAANSADLSIAVPGANTNDCVILGPPVNQGPSLITQGFVSSNGFITVRASNIGAIAVDQAALTYRVDVVSH